MKYITFAMYDPVKTADIAAASDKARANLPEGVQTVGMYTCLGTPFPSFPENRILTVTVFEAENSEDIAALVYPLLLAGAPVVSTVPVLDVTPGATQELEQRLRG